MSLVQISGLSLYYGEQGIFDDVELQLDPGDRLCIVGRNGVGKSTLLKVLSGQVKPDEGRVWKDSRAVIASLSQDLPEAKDSCVFDYVGGGVAGILGDIAHYEQATKSGDLKAIERLQQAIESSDGWNLKTRINQILTRLELDGSANLKNLSGGWRRRVALTQSLVANPDVLLLDEPTNHLDISAIRWLEDYLSSFSGVIVFITHDRAFLKAVANKIGELDRGTLTLWNGGYQGFLKFKRQQMETESKHNALFDKRLAKEEAWIREGIKARRTRNEGRVRALKKMREQRAERKQRPKLAKIEHGTEITSGKLVAELTDVSFAWQDQAIIDGFSCTILRGDKIGLIGPNGVGKSTLLKLILGEIAPQKGRVRLGTKLSVAYFDQLRQQLDMKKSAIDNIAEGRDVIEINGRETHVISYLKDFLFSGERARMSISALSGGECNRILLAKLFSKPSNLLVMDEPTNDLDAETLELLEDLLANFDGTLLLVSHDREFLDNVVTSTVVFEGNGRLQEYVGGYSEWLQQGGRWPDNVELKTVEKIKSDPATINKPKKLSYKLQRELEQLPVELEKLEAEINTIHSEIAETNFYQKPQTDVAAKLRLLSDKETQLEIKFARWEALEGTQNAL